MNFHTFHQRAASGERLTIAFFGASLTWGANATDPQRTSYRANVMRRFEHEYPNARFTAIDGAIGGTGSDLGVFRLQRDCLAHTPDLVFLDFSANDDIRKDHLEKLQTYESLVRRILLEGKCPLVMMLFPFKWDATPGTANEMAGRLAHLNIAAAYNVPVGDAILDIQNKVAADASVLEKIWDLDGMHPGDFGYQCFAESAWRAFQNAVATCEGAPPQTTCHAPEKMLHGDAFMAWSRNRLTQLPLLPKGWKPAQPNRIAAWYDGLMSRWLDDELVTTAHENPAPIEVRFEGSLVLLFGEETPKSGKYRVEIDGVETHTIDASSARFGGNRNHLATLARGLEKGVVHTLKITPVLEEGQELRFESLCVAGGGAKVTG